MNTKTGNAWGLTEDQEKEIRTAYALILEALSGPHSSEAFAAKLCSDQRNRYRASVEAWYRDRLRDWGCEVVAMLGVCRKFADGARLVHLKRPASALIGQTIHMITPCSDTIMAGAAIASVSPELGEKFAELSTLFDNCQNRAHSAHFDSLKED